MRNRPARPAALLAAAGCLVLAPILAGTGTAAGATTASTTASTTTTKTTSTDAARTCTREHPAAPRWPLAWHDEFGAPTLDRAKWNTVMDFPGRAGGHYHNSSYGSYALDANIVLGQGRLHLITDDEPVVGDDPPGTYAYSEGFVSSHDKFAQAYGYWEICARYPAGRGLWPAFWLVPQDRTWPPEFDVAEWFGGIDGMFQGIASGAWPNVRWDGHWTYDAAPTTGWHTYALRWEPRRATFYVDGRVTAAFEGDFVPDKPMYVVMNSGVWMNADRGGPPDAGTVFPNSFDVDYVRVYRRP
ncbi:glycoside hydrolase family 16 protein [Actinopolymorpha rutila]|uniref:Beta-glucanase (GH16 family) n=1 Tax=Actinopolymorpha rutila TaxID=446787 RepID=A0A852ZBQ9_9ACTN|nr:glycoside hydrolase family 16 protein [Actinopolymorpha rutila]NYH90344.1 beta-glucanase (GH16 family) [Actinopolymorpha rutila]